MVSVCADEVARCVVDRNQSWAVLGWSVGGYMADAVYGDQQQAFEANADARAPFASQAVEPAAVGLMPFALVYIDPQGTGSPNCKSSDPFCYVRQAVTLNRSLLAAGMPSLTVATNARTEMEHHLHGIERRVWPDFIDLIS